MRHRHPVLQLLATLAIVAILSSVSAATSPLLAQGKKPAAAKSKVPPGQAKKQVSPTQAVVLSRDLLVKHGFQVVRVELVKGAQVIHYRVGNQGRGRGLGPMQTMIIRPAGDIVTFESVPDKVRLDIRIQLGF